MSFPKLIGQAAFNLTLTIVVFGGTMYAAQAIGNLIRSM